jgi:hypothetical protein
MDRAREATRGHALTPHLFALLAVIVSTVLLAVAALAPAPPAALPFLAAVCIGGPMAAAWQLRSSTRTLLPRRRGGGDPITALRRQLDELPETQHPLGL